MITYIQASEVLQSTPIVVWIILAWFIPILLYFIVGLTVKGRSANGMATSKPMILNRNFWYPVIIWGLIQAIFLALLIFPLWIMPFD